MRISSYWNLKKEIREGEVRDNYLLIGENDFIKEEIINLLEERLLSKKTMAFDRTKLYGDEMPENVYQWISSPPVSSRKHLVVIYHIDRIQKGIEQLMKAVESSSKVLCIVLTAGEQKKKKRSKTIDWFLQNTNVLFCKAFSRKGIERWVQEILKKGGLSISKGALEVLWEFVGSDMFTLDTEIKKLLAYKDKGQIEREDMERTLGEERVFSIYSLEEAICKKDMGRALAAIESLLLWGEKPSGILYLLGRWLSFCIYGKAYSNQLGMERALNAMSKLTETELSMKRGEIEDRFALEELLYRIISEI